MRAKVKDVKMTFVGNRSDIYHYEANNWINGLHGKNNALVLKLLPRKSFLQLLFIVFSDGFCQLNLSAIFSFRFLSKSVQSV